MVIVERSVLGRVRKTICGEDRRSLRRCGKQRNGRASLAFSVLDLEKDDEVIVPDFTMISPVLAVLACGGIPVPLDANDCFPWPAWWGTSVVRC
jgi:hypothetical protein